MTSEGEVQLRLQHFQCYWVIQLTGTTTRVDDTCPCTNMHSPPHPCVCVLLGCVCARVCGCACGCARLSLRVHVCMWLHIRARRRLCVYRRTEAPKQTTAPADDALRWQQRQRTLYVLAGARRGRSSWAPCEPIVLRVLPYRVHSSIRRVCICQCVPILAATL